MKSAYRVLAGLIALGVAVQAASVAYGAFALAHAIDGGTTITKDSTVGEAGFAIHGILGLVIPLLAILLLIVSFWAGVPGGVTWAGIVLLLAVVQVVLGFVSFGAPVVGVLHGANALVLLGAAGNAARLAASAQGAGSTDAAEGRHSA